MKELINIVWFKRDLRIHDHKPLLQASTQGKVLLIYVVEPDYWSLPDHSDRQWQFIRHSLLELDEALQEFGQKLIVRVGDIVQTLQNLQETFAIQHLYSHQETGNGWTYKRDIAVAEWCRIHHVNWHEYEPYGVIRKLKERDGWAAQWEAYMRSPREHTPSSLAPPETAIDSDRLPTTISTVLESTETHFYPEAGRKAAAHLLKSFTRSRGKYYSRGMSSPTTAFNQCSRLSTHISFGTLSLRELTQFARKQIELHEDAQWKRSLRSFDKRLHWHCHFIQKLESAPHFEFNNMVRAFDGMREADFDEHKFQAWAMGQTGYPLVDACMRCLRQTGWLNFRMRAMLIAFASYQLWLHWRKPALHLAQCFTDYEPGIHYCQVQMQSGTTGINTLRMYNPVKQSRNQDPKGHFIRQWIPELREVTSTYIHEPWTMPMTIQQRYNCVIGTDYPHPIVDHIQAAREAKYKISQWRQSHPGFRQQAKAINQLHGSRRKSFKSRSKSQKKQAASPYQQQKLL